jgi:D-3-phosphoglycerate dehydrogenase
MNILITAPFDETYLKKVQELGDVKYESWADSFKFWKGEEFQQRLKDDKIGILVTEVDRVTADVLEGLDDLKLICVCRGTPSNVDLEAATENGVLVTNAPGRNAVAVAELAIGLMLSVARYMGPGEKAIREGKWDWGLYFSMSGVELSGRTLGLVGLGAVARETAKRLRGWDMRILAYDPYVTDEVAASVGAELTDLETVMRESDFISIHLPVTEETKGLVSAEMIGMMKPTAFFINTARAATIDEEAVLKALQEKKIAGGGFDVFAKEPLPEDSPFLELDNVVMTPHLGGATDDVATNHSRMAYEDIQSFLKGETPVRAVNPEAKS